VIRRRLDPNPTARAMHLDEALRSGVEGRSACPRERNEAMAIRSVFTRAGEVNRRSIMVPLRARTEPQVSRRALRAVAELLKKLPTFFGA